MRRTTGESSTRAIWRGSKGTCGGIRNDAIVFRAAPELPFGGAGASGMGRYGGWYGFETFSHMKAVMKRGFRFDVELRYPLYSDSKLKLLRRL